MDCSLKNYHPLLGPKELLLPEFCPATLPPLLPMVEWTFPSLPCPEIRPMLVLPLPFPVLPLNWDSAVCLRPVLGRLIFGANRPVFGGN